MIIIIILTFVARVFRKTCFWHSVTCCPTYFAFQQLLICLKVPPPSNKNILKKTSLMRKSERYIFLFVFIYNYTLFSHFVIFCHHNYELFFTTKLFFLFFYFSYICYYYIFCFPFYFCIKHGIRKFHFISYPYRQNIKMNSLTTELSGIMRQFNVICSEISLVSLPKKKPLLMIRF